MESIQAIIRQNYFAKMILQLQILKRQKSTFFFFFGYQMPDSFNVRM